MNPTAYIIVGILVVLLGIIVWKRTEIWQALKAIRLPRFPFPGATQPPAGTPAPAGTPPTGKPKEPNRYHPDRSDPDGIAKWLREHIEYYEKLIEWKNAHHEEHTPEVQEWLFWSLSIGVLLFCGAIAVATFLWFPPIATIPLPFIEGFVFNPQWVVYLFILVYLLAGFRSVDTDEVAGADFFGEPAHQFDSGLKWVPWLIFGFNKEPTTYVEAEFPGDADQIQWTDEKTELAPGKVRPLYVMTGEKPATPGVPDDRLPTDLQMNIGVAEFVQFHLVKSRFFDLEVNIGDIDPGKEAEIQRTITGGADLTKKMLEAARQMRDTSSSFLLEVLGQISLNEIRQHMQLINELLKLKLHAKIMDWGLELVDGRLTKTNAGHDFNEQLQKRGEAISKRDAVVIEAEGTKTKLVREGEGAASAAQALLEAKAKGYEAIGEVARLKKGREAINSQVVEKLAESGNVVVVGPQGITDMFGLVKAAQKHGDTTP
jgi:regulator of protease activity HflC (stomatin/prohibitin superfamily)